MFCTSCGKEFQNDMNFCPYCGTPAAGNGQNTQNYNNGYYQQPYGNGQYYGNQPPYGYNPPVPDVPSAGFNALGFFIPIVGLILYLVWKDTTPKRAKAVGKWALISFIIGFVFYIIMVAVMVAAYTFTAMDPMFYM
ncbi:MAG: zinc-ribbon domain-containing protein [Clostridia bacterium]|nr:zinc-ribbon domain-containing protein [Clostridia bacterium]